MGADQLNNAYGLTRAGLAQGRWDTLITYQFLHGSWPHVLINSVSALAFGAPVARMLKLDARGAAVFFAFYLLCGVLAGLGFVAVDSRDGTVGASGAVSGLLGAAVRVIAGRGRLSSLVAPALLPMSLIWIASNFLLGQFGLTPGAAGMPVAWQAHIAGYFAGLLLIGPFARLAGRGPEAFTP